jgi:Type II secretion system (T2SS), protein E, N-terminal domain
MSGRQQKFLEGRWACSQDCWSSMLRQRVERELGARHSGGTEAHAHRVPLGLLLLSLGSITETQLQTALEQQRQAKRGRIGDWLRSQTGLSEKEITRALAMQWNCPVFDLGAYQPQPVDIPRELIEAYRILPLPARGRGVLYLAFDSGLDPVTSFAVQHVTGARVQPGLASESAFSEAWTSILAAQLPESPAIPTADKEELLGAMSSALRDQEVSDARLARLHQHVWLRIVLASRADAAGPAPHRDYLYRLPAALPGIRQ